MRVIAGQLRGRRLEAPPGRGTRPTSDRVRQSLFNSLESRLDLGGAVVVDLFAGTGALGIEAWSRGADHVTFVERDRSALDALRRNLATLGIDRDRTRVVAADAGRWRPGADESVDVVLADPPYAFDGWEQLLVGLRAGFVIAESDRPIAAAGWEPVRVRNHGSTTVTMLEPVDTEDAVADEDEH
ncbi:MAG: 16S rRNA (guanine(966)-N(2))-methyltransferase RsmD [Actinomycetota bacterium]